MTFTIVSTTKPECNMLKGLNSIFQNKANTSFMKLSNSGTIHIYHTYNNFPVTLENAILTNLIMFIFFFTQDSFEHNLKIKSCSIKHKQCSLLQFIQQYFIISFSGCLNNNLLTWSIHFKTSNWL